MVHPFSSNTVSLLSNITCNLGSNNAFILFISLIAMSMLGPVTMHIWLFLLSLFLRQSHAINLRKNSVTPRPVLFFTHRCLCLNATIGTLEYVCAHSAVLQICVYSFTCFWGCKTKVFFSI